MALLQRSSAATETSQKIRIPLTAFKNADGSAIPATTPGAGQYAAISGGFGVGGHKLQGEAASGNTKTPTCKATFAMPQNYVAGTSFTLEVTERVSAVANTTADIDANLFKSNENGGVTGSDLCVTSAITHNSTSWVTQVFTITTTGLSPGDEIDIYLRHTVNDSGGATGAKGEIGGVAIKISTMM